MKLDSFKLKIIAMILMVLDHLPKAFDNTPIWFGWLGRLVAPIFFFFVAVTLHGIWDTEITLLSSGYLKYILLIMIAWLFIFILMKAGLTQVNQLRDEYNRLEER